MDPASYAALAFGAPVANRMLQMIFPSELERAQRAHLAANLVLEREKFEAGERRAREQLDQQRELHLQSLEWDKEKLKATQDFQRDYLIEQRQMDRWPLNTMAANIIRTSRTGFQPYGISAQRSWPLNVICKATAEVGATENLVSMVTSRIRHEGLFPYLELAPPAKVGVQSLCSTIYGSLSSEPCLLVFVGRLTETDTCVELRSWLPVAGAKVAPPIHSSPTMVLQAPGAYSLEDLLSCLITGALDCHLLLTQLGSAPRLTFTSLMATAAQMPVRFVGSGGMGEIDRDLSTLVLANIVQSIDLLAAHAPAIATEAASQAALDFHENGQHEPAEWLLAAAKRASGLSSGTQFSKWSTITKAELSPIFVDALVKIEGREFPSIPNTNRSLADGLGQMRQLALKQSKLKD